MRAYELRRGHGKNLEGDKLRAIAADVFGSAAADGGKVVVSYGAVEKLTTWTDGKQLFVDMVMKTGVPDDVATDTITRNNRFLEAATGYTARSARRRRRTPPRKGRRKAESWPESAKALAAHSPTSLPRRHMTATCLGTRDEPGRAGPGALDL